MESGLKTKFKRWDPGTGTWKEEQTVNSITVDGITVETITVNRLNPQGSYVDKLKGILNANTVSVNMGYDVGTLKRMKDDIEDTFNQNYAIVIPDDNETTLEFEGFPQELPMDFSPTAEITMDMTFEIAGKPDIVDGGPSSHSSNFGSS